MTDRTDLAKAVGVTAELCGTELSADALGAMVDDLARYPAPWVIAALTRCRREIKGRLSLAEIVTRLDDGRPGVEEAWAMVPQSESQTIVWTEELCKAWAAASPLIADGDRIAARMAFKEVYAREVEAARAAAKPVSWAFSLGWDRQGRDGPLLEAVRLGRLPSPVVQELLPHINVVTGQPYETVPLLSKPAGGKLIAGAIHDLAVSMQIEQKRRDLERRADALERLPDTGEEAWKKRFGDPQAQEGQTP